MLDQAMLEVETDGAEPDHKGRLGRAEPPRFRTDVAEAARACLQTNPYADVKSLQCECHEGVLVLRGQVSTYYHKQLAQEAVRGIDGIELVVNVVEVVGASHFEEEIHDERHTSDATRLD
jgi:osmotically-inducible protein OsmY